MKKLAYLEIFFTTGDDIKIPAKDIKELEIKGIKKDIFFLGSHEADDEEDVLESETAEQFEISVLKELLNTRNDFRPYDENMDIVENITNLERIRNYDNLVGVTLKYKDETERTIGIDWKEDTDTIIRYDGTIITIEIK